MSDSGFRRIPLEELAQLASSADNLAIVCGAGLSHGVAPLASDLLGGFLAAIEALANEIALVDRTREADEIRNSYFTLELFVSGLSCRVPALRKPLMRLYKDIFCLKEINRAHRAMAKALGTFTNSGKRAVALIANFDDGLTTGLVQSGVPYRLVTRNNVQNVVSDGSDGATVDKETAARVDVCAYHGTVQTTGPDATIPSGPTSMSARNLAHPFPPAMSQYVQQALRNAGLVLFIGHRGEDFYDLNIELRRMAQLGATSKARFLCVPHMGDPKSVAPTYEALFGKTGLVAIENPTQDWIGDLFDAISGIPTSPPDALPPSIGLREVTSRLLSLVEDFYPAGLPERSTIQIQCVALLDDIKAGALAAWSVIEHYRLESLGYTQDEISAFGRAPEGSVYYGIPIAELIQLQKDYQDFRFNFHSLDPKTITPSSSVIEEGLQLTDRLENFASVARDALPLAADGTQKAIARLLAAIPYDYCGLVGMRLMNVIHVSPIHASSAPSSAPLVTLLNDIDGTSMRNLTAEAESENGNGVGLRTELLFKVSAALAREAGTDLRTESAKFSSDPQAQEAYAGSLAQIVGWQDWELAPAENRLRLPFIPVDERLHGYKTMINKRMQRMETEEANVSSGERSFSAAGDAAQCAVRVCEVARLLAGVSDFGSIAPDPDVLAHPDAQKLLESIPAMARTCIRVASETSSVHNHLIMQAYDALLLDSLLTERGNTTQILNEAELYAKDGVGFQFETRLKGIKSRIS